MREKRVKSKKLLPAKYLVLGFLSVILVGSLLLLSPLSQRPGANINFLDALFTATSSVCVTGLVVTDTWTSWTVMGRVIIIILIQIGGLGFMSIASLIPLIFGKRIDLKERLILKEQMNQVKLQGIVALLKKVFKLTFIIEGMGACILALDFIPRFGISRGIGYAVFHSISAFCNAGFDLFGSYGGEYSSLMAFNKSPLVLLTITWLIILGGIGFPVIINIMAHFRKGERISLHTKIVVISSLILLILGSLAFFVLEYKNTQTIGNMSLLDKIVNSFMQSVTTRTAGFSSVDFTKLKEATLLMMILLMFIGASPSSTGGGIKTVTFAVILLSVKGVLTDQNEVSIFKKRLPKSALSKSLVIFFMAALVLCIGTLVLVSIEPEFNLIESAFESASALATVGCSIGGTANLSALGKLIIISFMFAGRLGLATLVISMMGSDSHSPSKVRYPEERVLIG